MLFSSHGAHSKRVRGIGRNLLVCSPVRFKLEDKDMRAENDIPIAQPPADPKPPKALN